MQVRAKPTAEQKSKKLSGSKYAINSLRSIFLSIMRHLNSIYLTRAMEAGQDNFVPLNFFSKHTQFTQLKLNLEQEIKRWELL